MSVTGIILAGGKSSRMGEDKSLVNLIGKPMIDYSIHTLQRAGISKIIINTNTPDAFLKYGFPICTDLIESKGPLAGIYSSLLMSETDENVIIPCDSPFITSGLLNKLIINNVNNQISFVKFKNKYYPLIGCFKKSSLSQIKNMLDENNLKARDLIMHQGTSILDLTNDFEEKSRIEIELANINNKEERDYYEEKMSNQLLRPHC
ncbi:MAG: molybdenum cofactor guanylyltransferase [Flavobacteriia bacterium]|jgi:molybdopterin-guanine dinucleotide biosynthesis protein A